MAANPEHDVLLSKARAGDRGALVKLLEALGPVVRQRIEPKIPRHHAGVLDADDIMQVTYLEAVLRLNRFASGDSSGFLAWLGKLAENNLIDAIRALDSAKRPDSRRRVEKRSFEDSATSLIQMLGATSTTPSRAAANNEAGGLLSRALEALPPDYAKVIRLYDLEGRTPAEVATELGRSQGAVFMLRARAHERLKEVLGPTGKYFSSPS